jgi:5-methylcytosine-specific restriction endonuclease McrA
MGLTFDHVIPIARGGPNLTWNIRPAHHRCNTSKNAKSVGTVAIRLPTNNPIANIRRFTTFLRAAA